MDKLDGIPPFGIGTVNTPAEKKAEHGRTPPADAQIGHADRDGREGKPPPSRCVQRKIL